MSLFKPLLVGGSVTYSPKYYKFIGLTKADNSRALQSKPLGSTVRKKTIYTIIKSYPFNLEQNKNSSSWLTRPSVTWIPRSSLPSSCVRSVFAHHILSASTSSCVAFPVLGILSVSCNSFFLTCPPLL